MMGTPPTLALYRWALLENPLIFVFQFLDRIGFRIDLPARSGLRFSDDVERPGWSVFAKPGDSRPPDRVTTGRADNYVDRIAVDLSRRFVRLRRNVFFNRRLLTHRPGILSRPAIRRRLYNKIFGGSLETPTARKRQFVQVAGFMKVSNQLSMPGHAFDPIAESRDRPVSYNEGFDENRHCPNHHQ